MEASLLVGDDKPAIDMFAWQETTLSAHRLFMAEAVADALETALADSHPAAVNLLGRALDRGSVAGRS